MPMTDLARYLTRSEIERLAARRSEMLAGLSAVPVPRLVRERDAALAGAVAGRLLSPR